MWKYQSWPNLRHNPEGLTKTKDKKIYWQESLQCLMESLCWKHLEPWKNQNWFNHHDNAPVHTVLTVQQFLATKSMSSPHPSYMPDWHPCDFFLFPRMKLQLWGQCFQGVSEIHTHLLTPPLQCLSQFQRCFQQWQKCWNHCINMPGDYIEENITNNP